MSHKKTKLVVAAIDFGTTYSGYAYSWKSEYEKDPFKIYANQDWTDGSGLVTLKAPTVVLFDKDKNFDSFGYDAETKYASLAEVDEHHGWRYFRRLKMKLYERVAGIPEDQLTLALEPEVAAIYCKELVVSKAEERGKEAELQSFRPGAQFMVLDLGGGTVDITVHEVERNGTLKELDTPTGGPWGGTMVDNEIYLFLGELFDSRLLRKFRTECKTDDLDLQRTIEMKKRQCKNKGADTVIKLDALFKFYAHHMSTPFETYLANTPYADSVVKKGDRLHIRNELFVNMFRSSKESLINHVDSLLQKPQLKNVSTVMIVGGFSESEIMKDAVRSAFPMKSVIVPDQAGGVVVKGAVMFGHNPDSITSRKLPYTYGISTAVLFDASKHPESKKVFRDGYFKCEDIFKVFIKAGTTVVPHKTRVEESLQVPYTSTSEGVVEIYRSKSETPIYVTDEGCNRIGEIEVTLCERSTATKQMVDVIMSFGDTQLHVEAREHGSANKVSAKFNFLR